MPNQELLDFIKESKSADQSDEQIKSTLLANGWKEADINDGFRAATNFNVEPVEKKSYKKLIFSIVVIIILLAGGAFGYYKYVYNKPAETAKPQPTSTPPCDNYQCLISAASQCQPISTTISYSGVPFPLDPEISGSGQMKYEIKKSSKTDSCVLVFSNPVASLSISDKGRKAALASGMTDAQITAQLQTMNDSYKSVAGMQTTCSSNTNAIVSLLTDTVTNMNDGTLKVDVKINLNETTYTTSSGLKLVCTDTSPRQLANTSTTIKDTACATQKGLATTVTDADTACLENQIDLGTITGPLKMNDKYPQCCVSR
ncbi:MAG: hypothetical protein Q7J30_02760 [Candidatus Azambacteria bacterium]|nr:hypothetical protein [Candidatus Azambacteria bacterium]